MDPRRNLKALQAEVAAARAAFDAGDRPKALEHLDRALSIDPSFLAAQSLRERVLARPEPLALPALTPAPQRRPSAKESHERIERRARQRRVDHCVATTRAALGRRDLAEAAATLDELIALEPCEPNVPHLSAELADLRRRVERRPLGSRLAAAAAFLAVAGTASWLEHPRRPTPVVVVTTALRTEAPSQPVAPAETAPPERPLESKKILESSAPLPPPPAMASHTIVAAPPRPSPAATAPLSLPVPLSQLPPATATPQQEPPAAAPAATTATAPVVEPAPVSGPDDRALIEQTLQRYRRAYGGLNVQSALAVYPTMNRVALARAFDGLESQSLTFDGCDIEVRGAIARAICHGSARYVPKIGNRESRTEPLVWSFQLRKAGGNWTIETAKASR